jgi:hypothetical protein
MLGKQPRVTGGDQVDWRDGGARMGYWGTLIAVRSGAEMPAALRRHNAETRRHDVAGCGDRWRVFDAAYEILDSDDALLVDLARESAAPVLAARIADSDYGWLVGVGPSGDQWGRGWRGGPRTCVNATITERKG